MEVSKSRLNGRLFATMVDMWEMRDHLPWRKTKDPYKILVSEMMLQQTQVERVVPFYNRFIKKYPTARALARAKLGDVLTAWNGLGYNRRAKFLHEATKIVSDKYNKHDKQFPDTVEEIEALPGVGHYTARAVAAFAFNKPEVFIETNIRTVLIHSFQGLSLAKNGQVEDKTLLPLVAETLKRSKMQPRDFYAAMMDYGAHLKKQGVRLNNKSRHYAKQSKFEGSVRQLRGAILRELLKAPATLSQLIKKFPESSGKLDVVLRGLVRDGLAGRDGRHRYCV